jgi:hypothetical protein
MELLKKIKNYLDITWELDETEEEKLLGLINSGKSYLNRRAGAEIDFESDDDGLMMLKDYVRYARSNALDEFENNYLHEIISLRNKYQFGGDSDD